MVAHFAAGKLFARRSMGGLMVRFLARFIMLFLIPMPQALGQDVTRQAAEAPALTVSVTKPAMRQWPETVPAAGWLRPWHEAVIASEANGLRVTEVLADVGSVVSNGQPLVRLSQDSIQSELKKQEAVVERARANLAKAKTNADRARNLRTSRVLSDERIIEYLTAERTAAADLASEEASLASQRIRLEQTAIVAADEGLITSRSAQLGAVVATGTELFRVVRQQRVEWQAEVAARQLSLIKEGMTAVAELGGGVTLHGKIRLVAPTENTETGRGIVYVEFPRDIVPRVGAYATGRIEMESRDALTVPETALVFRDGMNYVFVTTPQGRVTRTRVETGRRNDGEVEILSGLEKTADVVTSGGAFLADNALVKIVGATP